MPGPRPSPGKPLLVVWIVACVVVLIAVTVEASRIQAPANTGGSTTAPAQQLIDGVADFPAVSNFTMDGTREGDAYAIIVRRPIDLHSVDQTTGEAHDAVAVTATIAVSEDPPGLAGLGCMRDQRHGYAVMVEPRTGRWVILRKAPHDSAFIAGGQSWDLSGSSPLSVRLECADDGDQTRLLVAAGTTIVGSIADAGRGPFVGMSLAAGSTGASDVTVTFSDVSMTAIETATDTTVTSDPLQSRNLPNPRPVTLYDDGTPPGLFGTSGSVQRRFSYYRGEYRVQVLEDGTWWWWYNWRDRPLQSASIVGYARNAEMAWNQSQIGLMCITRTDVGYAFVIDRDAGEATVWRVDHRHTSMLGAGPAPTISFGTVRSLIRARCRMAGRTAVLDMEVNGYTVVHTTDRSGARHFIGVGVFARRITRDVDARFDNVEYGPTS